MCPPTSSYTAGFAGSDYAYADGSNGIDYYVWPFLPETDGYYNIYARWTAHSNRGNAEYSLTDVNFESTITMDQSVDGGQSNLLWSSVYLEANWIYWVRLNSVTDGRVVADSVTFQLID